jgi:hypothetical protein
MKRNERPRRIAGWTLLLCGALLPLSPPAAALPDYMEHWEFSLNADEDEGPQYAADLIVPLHRHPEDARVVFLEPRVSFRDREYLFNLGGGLRELVLDRTWLVGANMFYDYETEYSHYRLGWGLETLSAYAQLRSNFYLGLSQERLVEEHAGGNTFEEAVDGVDVEAGMPVPYYSRLKLFGGYNWYNYKNFKNRYGWTLRAEYTPFPFLVIDGLLSNDTKTNLDWGMTFALRLPLGGNLDPDAYRSPVALDATMFPDSDASAQLFRLVERHHDIVVERRRQTGAFNVEILRGT